MQNRKNTRRELFACGPVARRDAIKLAQVIADRLGEHPKLRGTTIVVTDEHGDAVCAVIRAAGAAGEADLDRGELCGQFLAVAFRGVSQTGVGR